MGGGAQNVTITYGDSDNNADEAGAAQQVDVSGVVGSVITMGIPAASLPGEWRYRLNANDRGLRHVSNIAFSAASTGTSTLVMGVPLYFQVSVGGNLSSFLDGLSSFRSLPEIPRGACVNMIYFETSGAVKIHLWVVLGSG